MSAWFASAKKFGEVQVSYEQWKKFLSIAYGVFDDTESAFLIHTYLSVVAKMMAYSVIRPEDDFIDDREMLAILDGSIFNDNNIRNFVDNDFFHWVKSDRNFKELKKTFRIIAQEISAFDFEHVDEDILKGVYQELIVQKCLRIRSNLIHDIPHSTLFHEGRERAGIKQRLSNTGIEVWSPKKYIESTIHLKRGWHKRNYCTHIHHKGQLYPGINRHSRIAFKSSVVKTTQYHNPVIVFQPKSRLFTPFEADTTQKTLRSTVLAILITFRNSSLGQHFAVFEKRWWLRVS